MILEIFYWQSKLPSRSMQDGLIRLGSTIYLNAAES